MTGEFGDNLDLTFGDGGNCDITATDFPDWNDLVGKFDMHGFVGANYSCSCPNYVHSIQSKELHAHERGDPQLFDTFYSN